MHRRDGIDAEEEVDRIQRLLCAPIRLCGVIKEPSEMPFSPRPPRPPWFSDWPRKSMEPRSAQSSRISPWNATQRRNRRRGRGRSNPTSSLRPLQPLRCHQRNLRNTIFSATSATSVVFPIGQENRWNHGGREFADATVTTVFCRFGQPLSAPRSDVQNLPYRTWWPSTTVTQRWHDSQGQPM
jgi:hypothetical protein